MLIVFAAAAPLALMQPARGGMTSLTLPCVSVAEDARISAAMTPGDTTRTYQPPQHFVSADDSVWLPASEAQTPSPVPLLEVPPPWSEQPPLVDRQQVLVPLPPAVVTGALMLAGNWALGALLWKKRRI